MLLFHKHAQQEPFQSLNSSLALPHSSLCLAVKVKKQAEYLESESAQAQAATTRHFLLKDADTRLASGASIDEVSTL